MMTLNEQIIALMCQLEYQIGQECYNSSSYNGWTGAQGKMFRYPLHYFSEAIHADIKTSYRATPSGCSENSIRSMHYQFGSNQLNIGNGLINVLNYLENRYGLDFAQLEQEWTDKKAAKEKATHLFQEWYHHKAEWVGKRVIIDKSCMYDEFDEKMEGIVTLIEPEYDDEDEIKSMTIRIENPDTAEIEQFVFTDGIEDGLLTFVNE